MIVGVGLDIVEKSRIKNLLKNKDRCLSYLFTAREIAYIKGKKDHVKSTSTLFSIKEAVLKGLRKGFLDGFDWKQIEVIEDKKGGFKVKLGSAPKRLQKKLGANNLFVDTSSSKRYVVAQAVFTD